MSRKVRNKCSVMGLKANSCVKIVMGWDKMSVFEINCSVTQPMWYVSHQIIKLTGMIRDFARFLVGIVFLTAWYSCEDPDDDNMGTVLFAANYHVINCITEPRVYIDEEYVGTITIPADSVVECNSESGVRKDLELGLHSYKIEIRPLGGSGCLSDIEGEIWVEQGTCETVFVDYFEIEWNN